MKPKQCPGKARRRPVRACESMLLYKLHISMQHQATLNIILAEKDTEREIVPVEWAIEQWCDSPDPWVDFTSTDPFDPKVVQRVVHNLQLIDDACEAMLSDVEDTDDG